MTGMYHTEKIKMTNHKLTIQTKTYRKRIPRNAPKSVAETPTNNIASLGNNKFYITEALISYALNRDTNRLSPSEYEMEPVRSKLPVSEYILKFKHYEYTLGSVYYQLQKEEVLQPYANIYIQDILTINSFQLLCL